MDDFLFVGSSLARLRLARSVNPDPEIRDLGWRSEKAPPGRWENGFGGFGERT